MPRARNNKIIENLRKTTEMVWAHGNNEHIKDSRRGNTHESAWQ